MYFSLKTYSKINLNTIRLLGMGFFCALFSVFLWSCNGGLPATEIPEGNYTTIKEIPAPTGFIRNTYANDSFALYLRNLPLKKDKQVHLHNGKLKDNQNAQYAVVNIDVGKRDLQQCADAVMRLRAEYLYQQKQYDKIHFNFTSGARANYIDYAEGSRAVVLNNQVRWAKTAPKNYDYKTFRKYLDLVFTYAGTQSLNKEMDKINLDEIRPGDVFIQTGFPYGHAVTVVDVATDTASGIKAFMLAQSFMPAQEIHILKNPEKDNDPWFYTNFKKELETPEWTFTALHLKRFRD